MFASIVLMDGMVGRDADSLAVPPAHDELLDDMSFLLARANALSLSRGQRRALGTRSASALLFRARSRRGHRAPFST